MQLPTARYTINGRYFTLKMSVEGKKTCYTDLINYDKFNADIARYNEVIKASIDGNQTVRNNSEFMAALEGYNKAIKDIKACNAGWADSYEFEPSIDFDYEEKEYIDLLGDQTLKFVSEDKTVKVSDTWFCAGTDVNSKYDTCIGANATNTAPTTNVSIYNCTLKSDGNLYECNQTTVEVPTARYAKKSVIGAGTYAPESVFYTKYSTGVIKTSNEGKKALYTSLETEIASTIPDSDKEIISGELPIALKTGRGVYNYGFKFNNIGEYFQKDGLGRLIGGKDSVVFANSDTKFKGTYVCSYIVNCPKCTVECVELTDEDKAAIKKIDPEIDLSLLSCDIPEKPCDGNCDIECVGECIYDEGYGQLFTVHQTSLTNFNASDRDLGANLTTEKGSYLIDQIESKGESIYEEPEYSFVFTPLAIEFVRNINDNSESFTELPSEWESKSKYRLYSEYVKDLYGEKSNEYKQALEHDYTIYESSILTELGTGKYSSIKAKALLDTREKVVSWLDSSYCKSHTCAMVGAIGPAWK